MKAYLSQPNVSLQALGDEYGVSKVMISKVLRVYFGRQWNKPRKYYECKGCKVMFHGWGKHYGKRAIYCVDCAGKYYDGKLLKNKVVNIG